MYDSDRKSGMKLERSRNYPRNQRANEFCMPSQSIKRVTSNFHSKVSPSKILQGREFTYTNG